MYLDQDGKRWFRGNLHTHSTVSDGLKTPDEVIRIYRNEGYDFLAFTDHWKPSGSGEKDGLLLIPGCEYDVGGNAADGIYHIVVIWYFRNRAPKIRRRGSWTLSMRLVDLPFWLTPPGR